jgi:hypothetical protein
VDACRTDGTSLSRCLFCHRCAAGDDLCGRTWCHGPNGIIFGVALALSASGCCARRDSVIIGSALACIEKRLRHQSPPLRHPPVPLPLSSSALLHPRRPSAKKCPCLPECPLLHHLPLLPQAPISILDRHRRPTKIVAHQRPKISSCDS